jgi:hypothetical protein
LLQKHDWSPDVAVLYYPDGQTKEILPENGMSITMNEMRLVIGADIDIVYLANGFALIVDDLGATKNLPYNPAATALYTLSGGQSAIFGPALHCRVQYPGRANERWF